MEFGTIAIYGHIFFHLRGRLRSVMNNDTSKLSRATKFMVMYPAVYVVLTLPIALGRMVTMGGVKMPDLFFCIAGSFLTSCGWMDALLYTLTRRVFVGSDISNRSISHAHHPYNRTKNVTAITTNAVRPGDDAFDLRSMDNKEVGAGPGAGRTVTIVGGSTRIGRIVDQTRGTQKYHSRARRNQSDTLHETSLTGSQDSIMKPGPNAIGIVTETNIQVESVRDSDSDWSPDGERPSVSRYHSDDNGHKTHSPA